MSVLHYLDVSKEEASAFKGFEGTLRRVVIPTPFRMHTSKEWRLSLRPGSPRFASPQALCDYMVHNNPWARPGITTCIRFNPSALPFAVVFVHQVEALPLPSTTRDCPVDILIHWGLLTSPTESPT